MSDIASDAVASQAIEIAQRAGLTSEAAVADDESLDWKLIEEKAEGHDTGVPAEQDTMLLNIADGMYKLSLSAGGHRSFSYQGQCTSTTVIATFDRNKFLVWALHVPALNAIVIAFRGTNNGANIASDLDFKKDPCHLGSLSCGEAHGGFLKLWADIRSSVITTVNSFIAQHPSVTTVYQTGHSLGAAVAIIAGLDFGKVFSDAHSSIKVRVVGFGVPRVGDDTFASKFGAFSSLSIVRYRLWRKFLWADQFDPVSLVPPAGWGFSHVGAEFQMKCHGCKSWLALHRIEEYQDTFKRLQHRGMASC